MDFNSHLKQAFEQSESEMNLTPEDIAALTHYPSLDKLFQDQDLSALRALQSKLQTTFQNLERVILRGSAEDSKRAQTAAGAVKNALDFLTVLEKARQ